jgi:hypothetical protein
MSPQRRPDELPLAGRAADLSIRGDAAASLECCDDPERQFDPVVRTPGDVVIATVGGAGSDTGHVAQA